ncbi:hypothetical protein ACEQ8H_001446 [Pleosporales sp. CAS-2024a]
MLHRGIQPGYIRALELALAYLFQRDAANEALVHEKLATNGTSLILSRDSKESNKLHRQWRKGSFFVDLDKLLSGGEPSRHDPSEALSSDSDEEVVPAAPLSTAAIAAPTSPEQQVPQASTGKLPGLTILPSESWRLLEVYFTYSQAWLPICSKQDVLRTIYSYPLEGLQLSAQTLGSGRHAELWSILAVATTHDATHRTSSVQQHTLGNTDSYIYATARALIPEKTDRLEISHVKALINLALVNLVATTPEAAWLLVGLACRITQIMDQPLLVSDPTCKNVLRACFLLDSFLALYLRQRPCFCADEVKRFGRVSEDGLDEWQPWNDGHHLRQQPRAPAMILSSFNVISDLVALMGNDVTSPTQALMQLKSWEEYLPSKLAFVCALHSPETLNPATILLRMVYFCTHMSLTPSETWLSRALELLERAQAEIGWKQLPPILPYLFGFMLKRSEGLTPSHVVQDRMGRIQDAIKTAWPGLVIGKSAAHAVTMSMPMPTSQNHLQPDLGDNVMAESFPHGLGAADVQLVDPPIDHMDPVLDFDPSRQTSIDNQQLPADLESFFDELASLDMVNNAGHQPQFMQNLGFAPGANMSDLFSEYIPMTTAFMSDGSIKAISVDHYGFYEEG